MPDGVFLNPVSGLHYVLFLFDQTENALMTSTLKTEQQLGSVQESVRQNTDRISFLENRHGGLEARVDLKFAADAEFSDWMLNRSEEDWLVVQGLGQIPSSSGNWQNDARRKVAELIKLVLNINRVNVPFEVLYVANPFRYQANRPPQYNVRMDSASSSSRIRDIFSGFFRRVHPISRPPALKGVSIRNKITPNSKIRIAILHQLGSIYAETNSGGSYKVRGFDPRPLLVTIPPNGSTDHQRNYTFMQAVTMLPANFSDEHLTQIYQVVSGQQIGNLQSLFVVLNDDDRDRCLELVKQKRLVQARRGQPSSSGTISGSFSGPGTGANLQSIGVTFSDLRAPPPPPPSGPMTPTGVTESPYGTSNTDRTVIRDRDRSRSKDRDLSKSRDIVRSRDKDRSRSKERDQSRTRYRSKDRDHDGGRDRDRSKDRERDRSRDRDRSKSRDRDRDRSRSRDRDRSRSRGRGSGKDKTRTRSRGTKHRRSSSGSSSERDRKRSKKSSKRRRTPSSASSSSASSTSARSGSPTTKTRSGNKSSDKSKPSEKSRER